MASRPDPLTNTQRFSWRSVYAALEAGARFGEHDVEFLGPDGLPLQLAHERPAGEMSARKHRRNLRLAKRRAEAARRRKDIVQQGPR